MEAAGVWPELRLTVEAANAFAAFPVAGMLQVFCRARAERFAELTFAIL